MGTEIHYKNSVPGYYSMRNANEDSNNSSWHLFNNLTSSHYYDGFTPRTVADAHLGQDKDELKQKMLQHEAIFKNQVFELHRLYRRQRDMMEEVKRREFQKHHISIDTSSSSNLIPSQKPYEDANWWQNPSFPLGNSTSIPTIFGAEISNSPLTCTNGNGSKDCEADCRPSKVRKKLFDLQLPAHEYIEPEEAEHIADNQVSEIPGFVTKNGVKFFLDDEGKKDGNKNTASNGLADLNEPVNGQVDFLGLAAKPARFSSLPFEGKSDGRARFSSCLREPGTDRSKINYASQCFKTSNLQTPSEHLHGKEVQNRGIYSEISSKGQHLIFGPPKYPFTSTSDTGNSWVPPWGKSSDRLSHNLTSFQTHPSFISSHKSHEVFRDKWHRNGNGLYNGSSSGSKEPFARLHSVGFDYQNCKGTSFIDLTGTTKDMDLNSVHNFSNEDDNPRNCDQTVLPWLKAKPVICKNGDHSGDVAKKKDDSLGTDKKLPGFSIFGSFCILKNDNSSGGLGLASASIEHRQIDINVACDDDDDDDMDKESDVKKDAEIKNHFDLNSCVTEDDDLFVTESCKSSKQKTMEIDLEAPAVSDIDKEDEHKATELKPNHLESEELEKIAAEAIVAISSQQDHVGSVSKPANNNDPLLWFVDVINSCEKNMASNTSEIDEYEMLTLQLDETKEEDYMPKPLVPEFQEPDEVGPELTNCRPRRGQARRGRPCRDFQRDTLPGITSLSRHEITEDIQIFGGLMKATGHSWNLGSTRRNGKRYGVRGRRKVKKWEASPAANISPPTPPKVSPPSKQVNSVVVLGLDERSLTGWGKTTRRPRRQRCAAAAAANSVAVQIT